MENLNVLIDQKNLEPSKEQLMTEDSFYIEEFAKLKEQKTELDNKTKQVSDWLKEYMEKLNTQTLENKNYILSVTESTSTEILATDLLKEIGFNIPAEGKDTINKLFSVNITEAKKLMGAMAINKCAIPGKTIKTMRLKKK